MTRAQNLVLLLFVLFQDHNVISSEQIATERFLKTDIEKALLTLSDRESAVVRLRYGLEDGNERTLEEIGEYLNVLIVIKGNKREGQTNRNKSLKKITKRQFNKFIYRLF